MSVDPVLRKMVDKAVAVRTRLWKMGAVASAIAGLPITLLPFVIPIGPGDLGPAIGIGLFGLALVGASFGIWSAAGRQAKRIDELVFAQPEQIAKVELIVIQQGGAGMLHAVHLIDRAGKRYGLIVGSLAAAEEMRARIVG